MREGTIGKSNKANVINYDIFSDAILLLNISITYYFGNNSVKGITVKCITVKCITVRDPKIKSHNNYINLIQPTMIT